MKNSARFLIAAAALTLLVSGSQAWAGPSSCCKDSIAASPKVRAMLDERNANCCATQQKVVTTTITSQATLAGSPKVQQMRRERPMTTAGLEGSEVAGYKATGSDGITASPKVRAMLDERRQTVEIAPLK